MFGKLLRGVFRLSRSLCKAALGEKAKPPKFLILKLGFSADILVYAKRVKDVFESLKTLELCSDSMI